MTTIFENARKGQRGEVSPPPIGRLLGFVLKVIGPGHAVFEMEADVHSETGLVTLRQRLLHAINHLHHHLRFVVEMRAATTIPCMPGRPRNLRHECHLS